MNAIHLTIPASFLNEPLVQRLGWTLVHTLWQGVVLAAALALVLRLLRGAPSHVRYAAGCTAMVMMVLAAGFTFTQIRVPATSSSVTGASDVAASLDAPI